MTMKEKGMKKGMRSLTFCGLCFCALLPLASCAGAGADSHDSVQAAEYTERTITLRVFGTQGQGTGASATLANTATWATESYQTGDSIGQNLKITAITEDAVEISDSETGARRLVRAGEQFSARLVEHESDRAVEDQGQHQWKIQAAPFARLAKRLGTGGSASAMEAEFAGYRGVRIDSVKPGAVLARLGLKKGDLVLAIDGKAATAADLSDLAARFSEAKSQVLLLTVARGGSIWEAAYVTE